MEPKAKKFKQVKAGTDRARLLQLADGRRTVQEIAGRMEKGVAVIGTILHCLRRDAVILGHTVEDGRLRIRLRKGVTVGDVVVKKVEG